MKTQENKLKQILVVVDYQGDFVNGVLAIKGASNIAQNIQREINSNKYTNIIYTMDTHTKEEYENSEEKKLFPNIHCEYKTSGWNLYEIKPNNQEEYKEILAKNNIPFVIKELDKTAVKETFFCKNQFDIWAGNDIYPSWFSKNFEPKEVEVVVVGVALNYCVFANVVGLVNKGYKVTILKDCVEGIKTLPNGEEDPSYEEALEYFSKNDVQLTL